MATVAMVTAQATTTYGSIACPFRVGVTERPAEVLLNVQISFS